MSMTSVLAGTVGGLIIVAGTAFAGTSPYQGMGMELHSTQAEGNVYRLYAYLDAGARIDAVYGNATGELEIGAASGLSFYQNAAGGNTSQAINSAFFGFVPPLEWDSYVSIGCLYQDGTPFGGNNLNDIGITWTDFENGDPLVTSNGSWFVTPDDEQGGELGGKVFIGQFTVAGGSGVGAEDVLGQVNLQGKDADGNTFNEIGATWVPAPGALALLGLAGIAGRRRRRA